MLLACFVRWASALCSSVLISKHAVPCGRETGMDVELADVPVHSLVPEPLRDVASVDNFMARLPEFDGDIAEQLAAAEAAGECLRFVGACILLLRNVDFGSSRCHVSGELQALRSRTKQTHRSHTC